MKTEFTPKMLEAALDMLFKSAKETTYYVGTERRGQPCENAKIEARRFAEKHGASGLTCEPEQMQAALHRAVTIFVDRLERMQAQDKVEQIRKEHFITDEALICLRKVYENILCGKITIPSNLSHYNFDLFKSERITDMDREWNDNIPARETHKIVLSEIGTDLACALERAEAAQR